MGESTQSPGAGGNGTAISTISVPIAQTARIPLPPVAPGPEGDRDRHGRFARGNPGGPGNPIANASLRWRRAFSAAVDPESIRKVADNLVKLAVGGEPWAIKELLDRCLGKPRIEIDAGGSENPMPIRLNLHVAADEAPALLERVAAMHAGSSRPLDLDITTEESQVEADQCIEP